MYRSTPEFRAPKLPLRFGSIPSFVVVGLALTVLSVPVITFAVGEEFPVVPESGFSVVTRGPMELVISQSGEIDSSDNEILVNKCEWRTRIISMVPEGTWVEKGDIVAELDSSEIRERFQERAVRLVNARANLADAEEDLRIQKLTNESNLAEARLQKRLSQLQLDGYREAEYPQKLHQLEADVALAEEDVARAQEKYEFVDGMVKLGYRTPTDREAERINVKKKKQALELAQDKLDVFTNFTHERNLTRLKSIADESKREYERVKLAARSAILSREIRVRSRQRSFLIYKNYQDRLQRSIDACTIRASRAGEVVYGKKRSRSSDRLEEGSSVRYLQTIAKIPDRGRLQVELRLHESNIRLIEEDQSAVIEVDAVHEQEYAGRVAKVSKVPLAGRYPNYHLREYRVTVDLDADPEVAQDLAPGMTAQVHIIAAQRQAVVRAPIQSVVEVGDQHVAFVRNEDLIEHRVVDVGISSDNQIEILSGLDEGEQIVSKPRVSCAQRIVALQKEFNSVVPEGRWLSFLE